MADQSRIKSNQPTYNDSWKDKDFDDYGVRKTQNTPARAGFISGLNFDAQLDEMLFNRMIQLKNLPSKPQGNSPGKIYWDPVNKKYKLWNGSQWMDVIMTSTTTTSTSTSTT